MIISHRITDFELALCSNLKFEAGRRSGSCMCCVSCCAAVIVERGCGEERWCRVAHSKAGFGEDFVSVFEMMEMIDRVLSDGGLLNPRYSSDDSYG